MRIWLLYQHALIDLLIRKLSIVLAIFLPLISLTLSFITNGLLSRCEDVRLLTPDLGQFLFLL